MLFRGGVGDPAGALSEPALGLARQCAPVAPFGSPFAVPFARAQKCRRAPRPNPGASALAAALIGKERRGQRHSGSRIETFHEVATPFGSVLRTTWRQVGRVGRRRPLAPTRLGEGRAGRRRSGSRIEAFHEVATPFGSVLRTLRRQVGRVGLRRPFAPIPLGEGRADQRHFGSRIQTFQ